MLERPTSQPDPEHLFQLKASISQQWEQLPPEHQASTALVLIGRVLEGEYGPWFLSAVETLWQDRVSPSGKFLPLTPISRAQLEVANLTPDEIVQLDENDLRHITHEIARHFANDVFWEELEYMARKTLEEKRKEGSRPGKSC